MPNNENGKGQPAKSEREAYRVRLPGFVLDNEVGLGDIIKKATSYVESKSST
jgi:hypothetical protein